MCKIHPCQILFRVMGVGGIFGPLWATQGCWYSMWQTPGTHASSTFHASHSLDAGHPLVHQPSSQCPFVRPHNLPVKKETTQVVPSQGRLTSPSIPSILSLLVLLPWLSSTSPSSVAGVVIQRDTLLAEINPF